MQTPSHKLISTCSEPSTEQTRRSETDLQNGKHSRHLLHGCTEADTEQSPQRRRRTGIRSQFLRFATRSNSNRRRLATPLRCNPMRVPGPYAPTQKNRCSFKEAHSEGSLCGTDNGRRRAAASIVEAHQPTRGTEHPTPAQHLRPVEKVVWPRLGTVPPMSTPPAGFREDKRRKRRWAEARVSERRRRAMEQEEGGQREGKRGYATATPYVICVRGPPIEIVECMCGKLGRARQSKGAAPLEDAGNRRIEPLHRNRIARCDGSIEQCIGNPRIADDPAL